MRRWWTVGALVTLVAHGAGAAERARSPDEAAVFVKVVGKLRVDVEAIWKESFERREVEIGTGSGFVVSPYGHVLTNQHVIRGVEFEREIEGQSVRIRLAPERIEVVVPPGGKNESPGRYLAAVDAEDAELDLAMLSISAPELPYLAFGDSDAAAPGEAVEVLGFPFGAQVEIGLTRLPDIVPQVSVSRGTVSALRSGDDGRPRYIQTTATLNPGNSGGPLVNEQGFVLGIVRSRLADATGIGFAIPINRAKDFLELNGLLTLLPVLRLREGPRVMFEGKGVALALPDEIEDNSAIRTRIDSREAGESSLRETHLVIDRVASPWSLQEIEEALLDGAFGEFVAGDFVKTLPSDRRGELRGHASGRPPRGGPSLKIEYALVDLGPEKLVARYLGPEETVAFNLSVLRDSLGTLEVRPLLTAEVDHPLTVEEDGWTRVGLPLPDAPYVVFPDRWIRESAPPFPCPELGFPDSWLSASPVGDFTISVRVAWWRGGTGSESPAATCAPERGRLGADSYIRSLAWLGTPYRMEGLFLKTPNGTLQLELAAPEAKHRFLSELYRFWVDEHRP